MSSIKLDTKLEFAKDRLKKTIEIALERVIAHYENPGYFPLPSDGNSLEWALHNMFETLPRRNKKDVAEKVNKTLKASKAERQRIYGDLEDVDFRSTNSLVNQIKTKPVPKNMKFTNVDLIEVRNRLRLGPVKPKRPRQAVEAVELGFDVVSLSALHTTDVRKDEVSLAGSALDNVGGVINVAPFFVGKFKQGETVALGGQSRLFNFKLTQGEFPKTFVVNFFVVEKDLLRNSDFIDAMQKFCVAASVALSAILTVLVVVAELGGPASLPLLIGLLVASTLLIVANGIIEIMRDDVSDAGIDVLVIDAPVAPGTVFGREPVTVRLGHYQQGQYQAIVKWVAS